MIRQLRKVRRLLFPATLVLLILLLSIDYALDNVAHKELPVAKDPEFPTSLLRGSELDGVVPANFHLLAANSEQLNYILRTVLFEKPSDFPYQLTNPDLKDFSRGQSMYIDQKTRGKRNGFFVEVGAGNGEKGSPSLFFERERQWSGLLIEPNKDLYKQLKSKNRKAYTVNSCVRYNKTNGSIDAAFFPPPSARRESNMTVPCFWMSNYFRCTKRTQIDALFIDVRGHELEILKTIPFNDIYIGFISIEIPMNISTDDEGKIIEFLRNNGFVSRIEFINHIEKEKDVVFQHS